MSDGRLDDLRQQLDRAVSAVESIPEDTRAGREDAFARLDSALAYASVVLQTTRPEFVTQQAMSEISGPLARITGEIGAAPENADAFADVLLDGLTRLPVAAGRKIDQEVKDAAASFQRSARQRLRALLSEADGLRQELDALKATFEERSETLGTEIAAHATNFAQQVERLGQRADQQIQRIDDLVSAQEQAFDTKLGELEASSQQRLDEVIAGSRSEVRVLVAEIERMKQESEALVGAIGLAGTAERYKNEAVEQRGAADLWRYATVFFAACAVGIAVFAAFAHRDTETLAAKLVISVILGGIAAYTARQSGAHRRREVQARDQELELTAFSPFIEPLSPEQQEEERVIMTRKTFGKAKAGSRAAEEEPGPGALSFLLRRRLAQEGGEPEG